TGRLVTREVWRRSLRRLRSGPLYAWRLAGPAPEGLTLAPQNLQPADAQKAVFFYEGNYDFAGRLVVTTGGTPFMVEPDGSGQDLASSSATPSGEWFDALHTFRWLRHLDKADTDLARAHAAALVADWIDIWGHQLDSRAWRTDTVAYRLIAWLDHSPLLVTNTSVEAYQTLLRMIGRHFRFLQRNGSAAREGYPRLLCAIALVYGSLCLKGMRKTLSSSMRELDREIERQILSTNAPMLRKPSGLVNALTVLLPLHQAFQQQGLQPSSAFDRARDIMLDAVRLFRHSDGTLARFNGTAEIDRGQLANVMRHHVPDGDANEPPASIAGGFHRLERNGTVVIIDAGQPNALCGDGLAMAGTLAFELSSGDSRFIVNCGAPDHDQDRTTPFARATAAHSTATVGDTSSSIFANDARLHSYLPSAIIHTPRHVSVSRKDAHGARLEARHDGYASRFGILHDRELHLTADGQTLEGTDRFGTVGPSGDPAHVAVRFHLPACIKASHLSSGRSILIADPAGGAWTFTCIDADMTIEESIQFSGKQGPRKASQIVIALEDCRDREIRWLLERRAVREKRSTRRGEAEADLATGDLLDTLADTDGDGQDKGAR
ncbi:MAG: heparinase II/III family protein, partial [Pseudomonadota bacterium]